MNINIMKEQLAGNRCILVDRDDFRASGFSRIRRAFTKARIGGGESATNSSL